MEQTYVNKPLLSLFALVLGSAVAIAADETIPFNSLTGKPVLEADAQPTGSVTFSGGSVAAGIGYVWGHGTLTYRDKQYKFKVSGVSVVDVGAANITATGDVYNLSGLPDFDGKYSAVAAGVTVGGGGSVAYLSNGKGVVIKLHSTTQGLRFNLSADGVRITLQH
jgi:hypothetical protein